jgi:predicted aldo/keto reductase-like oxidoreductase
MKRRTLLAGMLGAPALLAATPEIPRRRLGHTGLSVSVVGFGCAPGLKDAAIYRSAIDLGVNYFHVGDRDPKFDRDVLRTLRPLRQRILIGLMTRAADTTVPAIDSLLADTGVGAIDIWYLISPKPEDLTGAAMEALVSARRAGKVRHIGISTHSLAADAARITAPGSTVEVVMMTYNFLSPAADVQNIERLRAAGVGIVPMKTMGGGFRMTDTGVPAAIARWIAADRLLDCAPVAVDTVEQLQQNVAALGRSFDDVDRALLNSQRAVASYRFCRLCGSCRGACPRGVPTSDLVRCAMYAEGYRDVQRARAELARLHDPGCGDCTGCIVKCPHGVAIPQRVNFARALLA